MRRIFAALLLAGLSACSDLAPEDTLFREAESTGAVWVPLLGRDAQGRSYALRGATFEVSGTAMLTLSSSGPSGKSVKAPLPSGQYQVFLRPGYQLAQIAQDGTQTPVAAALASPNPTSLHVKAGLDGQLSLAFARTDGEQQVVVRFNGQGPLGGLAQAFASAPAP